MRKLNAMRATVVLPTYTFERFKDTIEAIESLLQQTFLDKEIIVVVDRNRDLFRKLKNCLPHSIKVALSAEGGASNARNMGVKIATGDIIAFIDDDAIADKNWLSAHVNNFEDPTVIGAGGPIKPLPIDCDVGEFPEELYWLIGCTHESFFEKTREVRNNFGGNCSFRREVFDDLSFPTFLQNLSGKTRGTEDTEFCIRVLEKNPGYKLVHDSKAVVYHKVYPNRMSLKYILRRSYSEGTSKAYIANSFRDHRKTRSVLSRESSYLSALFFRFLPTRIKQVISGQGVASNLKSIILFSIVVGTVIFGYVINISGALTRVD